MQTLEKTKGIEVLKEACAACSEAIAARKGRMLVKDEARVVSVLLLYLPRLRVQTRTVDSSCMRLSLPLNSLDGPWCPSTVQGGGAYCESNACTTLCC